MFCLPNLILLDLFSTVPRISMTPLVFINHFWCSFRSANSQIIMMSLHTLCVGFLTYAIWGSLEVDCSMLEEIEYPLPECFRRFDDMILPENYFSENVTERNAVNSADLIWPKGRIPYVIDNSLSQYTNNIYQAMREYHSKTCIRFVPRNNEYNYVKIFSGNGCYSLIGAARQGQQPLSLGRGCLDHGTIVHELGHAVGFYHEQNRSDRDNHLIIHWENIQQGYASQFYKLEPNQNWLINGFDVSSIMLYGELSFSKDGYSRTMTHRGGQKLLEVYQKRGLSYADVQRVNRLYGC